MNSFYNSSQEYEINLTDFFWKLLMQWKAIFIVCLIMALIVPGTKYLKDLNAYNSSAAREAEAEKESALPKEERISKVLESLPEDEAAGVQYLIQTQSLLNKQKDYFNNSLWLNSNPTSQRCLSIVYYLQNQDDTDMQALIDAYSQFIRRKDVMEALRNVILPEAPIEYIYELVSSHGGNVADNNVTGTIYTVDIVLPDNVNADSVSKVIDSSIAGIKSELNSSLGRHSIKKINSTEYKNYSANTVDRRYNVSYSIYNLNNIVSSAKNNLNGAQQKALDLITAINDSSSSFEQGNGIQEDALMYPVLEPKYALLGFLFGAFLYISISILLSALSKTVYSASAAHKYSGARVVGEFYVFNTHKGIKKLFTSRYVARIRYKGKLNVEMQSERIANTIDAICSHRKITTLTLLSLDGISALQEINDVFINKYNSNGQCVKLEIVDAEKIDEKALSKIGNAFFVLGNKTKIKKVYSLRRILTDYDIAPIGTLYLEKL